MNRNETMTEAMLREERAKLIGKLKDETLTAGELSRLYTIQADLDAFAQARADLKIRAAESHSRQ